MEYLALGIAAFLGGVVSGFAGFAFSAAAGAILLHFLPPICAIPLMMLCSIASQMTSLAMLHKHVVWTDVWPLLVGGALGVPVALYVLTMVRPDTFRIAFGVFLIGYAFYMVLRPAAGLIRSIGGPLVNSAVGFAGGLVGGLTAMPGALPAIWCELRGETKERQRALVQPFILGMQAFAVVLLLLSPGVINRNLLGSFALAVPALAAGTFAGMALFGRVDDQKFRLVVLLLLGVSGGLMIH
jgi:uncharacterized membrane protein YfcA